MLAKSSCPPEGDRRSFDPQGSTNRGVLSGVEAEAGFKARAEQNAARPIAGLTPRMEQLLVAVCIYREPADRNAILFQLGEHDRSARVTDRRGPTPPYRAPADLPGLIASCITAELLSAGNASTDSAAACWVVDSLLTAELHRQLISAGRRIELMTAHRRAAAYWEWRAEAWPQGRRRDLHDLLEARHHLYSAGEAERADQVTHMVCGQLHAWGDLDREIELIHSTLAILPGGSASSARWTHELGAVYQARGDDDEAQRCYRASAGMFYVLGEYRGVARGHYSLGALAQAQGDYRRAERHYRRSSAAEKKAGSRSQVDPVARQEALGLAPPLDRLVS